MTESTEIIRQKVIAAFKTIHEANYPSTLCNYPNFTVVDFEHQIEPYVTVEIDINPGKQLEIGSTDTFPTGLLSVYFYYPAGKGLSGACSYTDMLMTEMGLNNLNGIQYGPVSPVPVNFQGWPGKLNMIKFNVQEEC